MDITINQEEIGRRIREVRLKKGLKQKDVWDGLFSSGKYSGIENGTYINFTEEDLELICGRLGINKKDILPDEPLVENIKSNILTALFSIKTGLFNKAQITLEGIKEDVEHTPSMHQYYRFTWAEYYINQDQYEYANTYLNEIIQDNTISFLDQEIKIRAFNALAYIAYKELRIYDATEICEQAIEYLLSLNAEFKRERAITYYNTALFHCYLMDFEYARTCILRAIQYGEPESSNLFHLLLSIIEIQGEMYSKNIKKTLDDLAASFFRNDDFLNWTKVLFCQYSVYKRENSTITNFLLNFGNQLAGELSTDNKVVEDISSSKLIKFGRENIETILKLSQIAYVEKEYNISVRLNLLAYSFGQQSKLEDDLLWAQIYAMSARLARENKKDPQVEEYNLDKALKHLESFPNSTFRALLLYEKARLTNQLTENHIIGEVARIYNKNSLSFYSDKIIMMNSLPVPQF